MKKVKCIAFSLLIINQGLAQQVLPMNKSADTYEIHKLQHDIYKYQEYEKMKDDAKLKKIKIQEVEDKKNLLANRTWVCGKKLRTIRVRNKTNRLLALGQDTVRFHKEEELYSSTLVNSLKTTADEAKNKIDTTLKNVFIYGFGSGDAVNQSKITTNGGFAFGANIHSWDRLFLSIGVGGTVSNAESSDSVNLNSIYFPDNAKSILNAHYEISTRGLRNLVRYKNRAPSIYDNFSDDFLLFGQAAVQQRSVRTSDSLTNNYGVYNLGAGVIYRWTKAPDSKNKFSFDLGIGFGYVEIAKQNRQTFETVISPAIDINAKIPPISRGLTLLASIQYNDLLIYMRVFNELSRSGQAVGLDSRIYFSTGIKVTGSLFSF